MDKWIREKARQDMDKWIRESNREAAWYTGP